MDTLIILAGISRLKAYRLSRDKLELLTSVVFPPGLQTPQDTRHLIRMGQTASGPLMDYTDEFHRVREFRDACLETIVRLITHLVNRYPCEEIYLTSAQSITLALHERMPREVADRITMDYSGDFTNRPAEVWIKLFKIRPLWKGAVRPSGRHGKNRIPPIVSRGRAFQASGARLP